MKLNIRNKINKQDIILFVCVFIFSLIANNAFLQRHYSSDAMCLIYHGYFEYPSNYFLLDGRIISTLVCYIGGILNLPFDMYLFISNFVGIFLLALTITILFKFTIKYLEIENKWIKFLILLAVYTIIFNHMDIEYLLFPESCVMCAGVLFSVIAAIRYLNTKKGRISESFYFLLLSSLCYQGLLSIFPTIVITLSLLKKKKNTKRETLKFYIKEIFKLGIMYVLVMLISASLIFIFNNILNNSSNRLERIKNTLDILLQIPRASFNVLISQTEKIPLYLSVVVMSMTAIITIKNNNLLFKYILTMFTAYLFCMGPIAVFGYIHARLLMAIGATMGISLVFVIKALNDDECSNLIKKINTVLISISVIGYFVFNVVNNGINSYQHLKAFKIDEELGKVINEIIKEYEENSGKEVTKFAYYYDINPQSYSEGILPLGSLTERKFAMPHCIKESISYYSNKKLEGVQFSVKVYYSNFVGKDYREFSEEQLVFIDDTLYMCVY